MVGAWQALAFLLTELGAGQPWGDLLSDLVPASTVVLGCGHGIPGYLVSPDRRGVHPLQLRLHTVRTVCWEPQATLQL